MNTSEIGKFIKKMRIEKNMSQNDLASELNISRQSVSKWENGINIPDSSTLMILGKIFDVSVDELLLGHKVETSERSNEMLSLTLSIVDENNRNTKILKRLKKVFLIFFTLFVFYLGYYFLSSYNSIQIYLLQGSTENFMIHDGIFVNTDNEKYLLLGSLESSKYDVLEDVVGIQGYYKKGEEEINLFYRCEPVSILLEDNYHNIFFDSNKIDFILNHFYLRIELKDGTEEVIKVEIAKKVTNSNFLFRNSKNA